MDMRTIGVVTVARSDYGLYVPILKKIQSDPNLKLLLYVSGAHFDPRFGNTIKEIEKDGFSIAAKVPIENKGDGPADTVDAMGRITMGFADVFKKQKPDILLVLGDRFDMHAAAIAAIPFHIPLAHIHGGELTYGAIDEFFRHSLTKISTLHFATTEAYAQRIIQMGEEPRRVIVCGAPGIDSALASVLFSKEELEKKYSVDFSQPIILVTFHPVTMEHERTKEYVTNFLSALDDFKDCNIVFTYPNADMGYEIIINEIESYVGTHKNTCIVKNFGHQGHLSMMKYAAVMAGNSSSGIIEAASFKLPVVNIGIRQEGRVRAKNVIDVDCKQADIEAAIKNAMSEDFRSSLSDLVNPYGDGKASEKIVKTLADVDLQKLQSKRFYDVVSQN